MSGPPHFSVIIPTYQRNDLLAKCLECLAPGRQEGMMLVENGEMVTNDKQESENRKLDTTPVIPPICGGVDSQVSAFQNSNFASYEVIVADDGRATTSESMLREQFPWARWVAGPGTGPAANRNAGAASAVGTWLAFTDDDCLPQPEWLNAYKTAIGENPRYDVFEGDILPDRPRQTLAEHAPVGGGGGNLWSCNFAICRSAFVELGGFDVQFRVCMEDSDFALRVRNSGRTYPFLEKACVIHPWRARKLNGDGWKSNAAELADHVRFRNKHAGASSISMARTLLLALRVLWRDLGFVRKHGDLKGIPYAVAGFWHAVNVAVRYAFPSLQK
jgi:GT2 family glycosyltransferase